MLITCLVSNFLTAEPQESDHDDEPVGRAIMVRLQAALGAQRIWGGENAPCAL